MIYATIIKQLNISILLQVLHGIPQSPAGA